MPPGIEHFDGPALWRGRSCFGRIPPESCRPVANCRTYAQRGVCWPLSGQIRRRTVTEDRTEPGLEQHKQAGRAPPPVIRATHQFLTEGVALSLAAASLRGIAYQMEDGTVRAMLLRLAGDFVDATQPAPCERGPLSTEGPRPGSEPEPRRVASLRSAAAARARHRTARSRLTG
jgi:hypothetical protein